MSKWTVIAIEANKSIDHNSGFYKKIYCSDVLYSGTCESCEEFAATFQNNPDVPIRYTKIIVTRLWEIE